MAEKEIIDTDGAPQNDNPYSQGVRTDGDLLFVSGQGPNDPDTGEQAHEEIGPATTRTLQNLMAILEEAGASVDDVVKATVYLADMDDYDAMNEAYAEFFDEDPPARVCIEASRLPGDIPVEIELFAQID